MRKENKTQKIIGGIFLVVLMLGLVSAATNTSIMYAKNSSGAIAPLEMNDQGRLKVNLNLLNITASSIATVGNFSLGQKITFAFGEMIDNIQDGWIRVTGGLNVTSNFSLGGKLLSNDNGTLKWGGNDVSTNISILYAENSSGGVQTLQVADNGALKLEVGSVVSDIWEIVGGVTRLVAAGNVNLSNVLFVNSTSGRVGIGTASPTHALNVIGNANITGDLYLNSSSLYLGDKKISNEGGVISFDGQNITPTGMVVAFNLTSCPSGWTEANGSNGTPDLRGIFIRGAGTNAITKMANGSFMTATYGTYSNDSMQGHLHEIISKTGGLNLFQDTNGYDTAGASGVNYEPGLNSNRFQATTTDSLSTATGTPRSGAETAPASYALIYCVKETGSDYAEWIESSEEIWEGMIVSVDEDNDNRVVRSKEEYDKNILGVVSTQPGWIIGEETKTTVKLALVGQVPVRVSLENGEIKRGDAITSSSLEGFGMKATEDKRIVGISLTELNEDSEGVYECGEELCGAVKVLLDLSWKNENVMDRLNFLEKENEELREENNLIKQIICEELGRAC